MDSPYQKYVNVSLGVCALLLAYVIYTFGAKLGGIYDLEARVRDFNVILQGAAAAIGLIFWVVLWKNDHVNQYLNEVMVELARVTWPTQKETASATFVVIAMVLISGLILGFLDYFWNQVIQLLLR